LIVYDERGISADKYKNIIYDILFFLINDLLEPPDDSKIIQIMDENICLFM